MKPYTSSEIKLSTVKEKISTGWKKVKPVAEPLVLFAAMLGLGAMVSKCSSDSNDECDYLDNDDSDMVSIEDENSSSVPIPHYRVEFKGFRTGEWYTKTETNNIGSAYSVADCHNHGRAYRIIDTETGEILAEEDSEMAKTNGYV